MDNGSSSNLQVRTLYLIKNHALFEETDDVISGFFWQIQLKLEPQTRRKCNWTKYRKHKLMLLNDKQGTSAQNLTCSKTTFFLKLQLVHWTPFSVVTNHQHKHLKYSLKMKSRGVFTF